MDPDVAAITTAAATAVVTAMAKDGWEGIRSAVSRLWRKETVERAAHVEAELENSKGELVASSASQVSLTRAELVNEWQGKIRRLLVLHPELAGELKSILNIEKASSVAQFGPTTHYGNGDINQAGRDIIAGRPQRHPND